MAKDFEKMLRTARRLIVQGHTGEAWLTLTTGKVLEIACAVGREPSTVSFTFDDQRWSVTAPYSLTRGSRVRIVTDDTLGGGEVQTIVFVGFVTTIHRAFSGGDDKGGAFERLVLHAADHRWLMARTSILRGIFVRSVDDYTGGDLAASPIANSATYLAARPLVFNADGRPDKDPVDLVLNNHPQAAGFVGAVPIHCPPSTSGAEYWTLRDMLRAVLNPLFNKSRTYTAFLDPAASIATGLKLHSLDPAQCADLDTVLHAVSLPAGIDVPTAVEKLLAQVGLVYREDPYYDDGITWSIYRPGAASATTRDRTTAPIILHTLYVPAPGEDITAAVAAGSKMVTAGIIEEDITPTISRPLVVGAADVFETTFELVPAWEDDDLVPDLSGGVGTLFVNEADLQQHASPDGLTFFNKYHASGAAFKTDVGRKWALNESGRYTPVAFDRGPIFDFTSVCDADTVSETVGGVTRRTYGPFDRAFLPSLTLEEAGLNSIGVKTEFSFDGGESWQTLSATITVSRDECAIHIEDANLSEILPAAAAMIYDELAFGLADVEQNYWTSLCRDKLRNFIFSLDPEAVDTWRTRVRVTAAVRMDQSIASRPEQTADAGTPFEQTRLFDLSDRVGLMQRMTDSVLTGSAWETTGHAAALAAQAAFLQGGNQDAAVAGRLTLDRLWLGDGTGVPTFCCGDGVAELDGRNLSLKSGSAESDVYPEIVKVVYLVQQQKTDIVLRDTKMARVQFDALGRSTEGRKPRKRAR